MNEIEPTNKPSFYDDFIKPNLPKNKKEYLYYFIVIIIIVTLGLIATNQYLAISYKATFILNPCALCKTFMQNKETGVIFGIDDLINNKNYSYVINP